MATQKTGGLFPVAMIAGVPPGKAGKKRPTPVATQRAGLSSPAVEDARMRHFTLRRYCKKMAVYAAIQKAGETSLMVVNAGPPQRRSLREGALMLLLLLITTYRGM